MKYKTFTQAYFLIKNNSSYGHSLGKRAQAGTLGGFILGMTLLRFWPTRIPAEDKVY